MKKSWSSLVGAVFAAATTGCTFANVTLQYFNLGGAVGAPIVVAQNSPIFVTAAMRPPDAQWLRLSTDNPLDPTAIIGPVTVTDEQALDVLVAWSSVVVFPDGGDQFVLPGAYEFKGLTFESTMARDGSTFGAWLAFADDGSVSRGR